LKYFITFLAISGQISLNSSNFSRVIFSFNKSCLFSNNFDNVFAVFFPTQDIHKAVIKVAISIFLAFCTHSIKLLTDFSLNHSNSNISSFFSSILKISTKL
jgi:hypothetical protein